MSESGKKIIGHASIYFLANILRRAIGFLMLPIYTRFLTPADFGTLELLGMIIDFVGILVGLQIGQAVFRYYNDFKEKRDKNEVVSTSLYLVFTLSGIATLALVIFAKPLSYIAFGDYGSANYVVLFSLSLIAQSVTELGMTFIRVQQRPWLFLTLSLSKLIVQLGLSVYFLAILNLRVEGVIYSAIISGLIISVVSLGYTVSFAGTRWSFRKARALISFSIPLALSSIVSFYLAFGDRFFLRLYGGLTEVGLYALAYKFGFLLMFIVVSPFASIWESEKYRILANPATRELFQRIFLLFSLALILTGLGISLFAEDALRMMADSAFWSAGKIVPIIVSAYIFQGWLEVTNLGILLEKKTIEITYGTLIGGLAITLGYVLLIPLYGATGAAWATVVGYGTRSFWITWRAQKLYNMHLAWGRTFGLLMLALAAWILSRVIPTDFPMSIVSNLFAMVLFVVGFMILPILPRSERKLLLAFPRTLGRWGTS